MASSPKDVQTILASSARGASFLISLQIGTRALTFLVNQIVVRFLSPELLGVSSQLELFAITVLTFSRESIRVSLGRHGDNSDTTAGKKENGKSKKEAESYATARRAQEVVNISYIAVVLGPVIALFFSWLYWRNPERAVMNMPYIKESFAIYALATLFELCMEPCFAIVAQQTLFGVRGSGEGGATFVRCIVNCGLAIWSSRTGTGLGPLPFALGQLSYAVVLNLVYYGNILPRSWNSGFSLLPRAIQSNSPAYFLSRFSRSTAALVFSLYAQSGLKHILTQGDSLLIAMFTSLSSQGIYALASNYGSLLARMLFQPVEESSRGVFARLCSATAAPISAIDKSRPQPNIVSAHRYLLTVLHLYALLSTVLLFIAPHILPLLLPLLAGPRFSASSGAPQVLGLYAYYLPLLAFNGLLEAFVAATATPAQLQVQARAMVGFSVGFAAIGWAALGWGQGGAQGLVGVNAVNMIVRILWSYSFVRKFFEERGVELNVRQFLPGPVVSTLGVGVAGLLATTSSGAEGDWLELGKIVGIGGVYGLVMLYMERGFLVECYRMLRPAVQKEPTTNVEKEKKET